MPPPVNNPLAAACYYDQPDIVKALLASGADPLAGGDRGDLAIFRSLFCAIRHPNARSVTCIELLLATDKFELVAQRGSTCSPSLTPLVGFLSDMADDPHYDTPLEPTPPPGWPADKWATKLANKENYWSAKLAIVCLLLDAGASLEPLKEAARGERPGRIHDVFEHARVIGNAGIMRVLEEAARLRYSPKTHGRFPRPARYAAAEVLRLGYQIGSQALVPVWAEHVLPFLVSRTSRGSTPTPPRSVLFIDALSDEQVEAMLEGDYAEHATRELQRRADGGNTAESNIKDALREWPHERSLLNCLALCGDAWEAGGDILRARGPLDDDPPSVRIFLASSSNARIEE